VAVDYCIKGEPVIAGVCGFHFMRR
jgi:hypothetical protein